MTQKEKIKRMALTKERDEALASLAVCVEALEQLKGIVNGAIERREDYILPVQLISVNTLLANLPAAAKHRIALDEAKDRVVDAAREAIESMTATHYTLSVVRPAMEKIEGPDWLEVFNGMTNEYELLQDALARLAALENQEGEKI